MSLKRGDSVKATTYRDNARGRQLVCSQNGVVEMVWRDSVLVKVDGAQKPTLFKAMDVEKLK